MDAELWLCSADHPFLTGCAVSGHGRAEFEAGRLDRAPWRVLGARQTRDTRLLRGGSRDRGYKRAVEIRSLFQMDFLPGQLLPPEVFVFHQICTTSIKTYLPTFPDRLQETPSQTPG